jgi:hypothetical protein
MDLVIYLILNVTQPKVVQCSNGGVLTARINLVEKTVKYTCRKWTSEMHNWQRGYNLPEEDVQQLCEEGTVSPGNPFCAKRTLEI